MKAISLIFLIIFCLNSQFAEAKYKILYKDGTVGVIRALEDNSSVVYMHTRYNNHSYHKDDFLWFYLEESFFKRIEQMNKIRKDTLDAYQKNTQTISEHQATIDAAKQNLKAPNLSNDQKKYLNDVIDENQKNINFLTKEIAEAEKLALKSLEDIRNAQRNDIQTISEKVDRALSDDEVVVVEGFDDFEAVNYLADVNFGNSYKAAPLTYKASCKVYSKASGELYMDIPVYSNYETFLKDSCNEIALVSHYKVYAEVGKTERPEGVKYLGLGYEDGRTTIRYLRVFSTSTAQDIGAGGDGQFIKEFKTFEMPD